MSDFKKNLNNQREKLKEVFNDTLEFINSNELLRSFTENSKNLTEVRTQNPWLDSPAKEGNFYFSNVFVTKSKTLEAALRLHKENPANKIAILNFASATNPGGGVTKGSSAQEESICRCTNLYPCLNTGKNWKYFYTPHKAEGNPLHNDDIIYTPGIIICKSDDGQFRRLTNDEFVTVDVITCAAPNLRENPNNYCNQEGTNSAVNISDEDLYKLHLKRARNILYTALRYNVDILVLGAFGCGAFKNNPYVVAKAYKDALKDYATQFKEIEFAIYCKGYETENYDAFAEEFK